MECPSCGSNKLERGDDNLWCTVCGFFPILFEEKAQTIFGFPVVEVESPPNNSQIVLGDLSGFIYNENSDFGKN